MAERFKAPELGSGGGDPKAPLPVGPNPTPSGYPTR